MFAFVRLLNHFPLNEIAQGITHNPLLLLLTLGTTAQIFAACFIIHLSYSPTPSW